MKLTLTHGDHDAVILEATFSGPFSIAASVKTWVKHPEPAASPPADPGPTIRASGHLASSERGFTPRPRTRAFGFGL
jgi:hypothetical protein